MAFSPGDYSGDGLALKAARNVRTPVFATSSGDAEEQVLMDAVIREVKNAPVTRFQPETGGAHGASALRTDRNSTDSVTAYWAALLNFLKQH